MAWRGAMELKVWVEGIQRIVCGVTETTTCQVFVWQKELFSFDNLQFRPVLRPASSSRATYINNNVFGNHKQTSNSAIDKQERNLWVTLFYIEWHDNILLVWKITIRKYVSGFAFKRRPQEWCAFVGCLKDHWPLCKYYVSAVERDFIYL